MKKRIFTLFMMLLSTVSFTIIAQKNKGPEFEVSTLSPACDTIWILTDKNVDYPGGIGKMYEFLFKKMEHGEYLQPNINTHKMMVKVLVDSDGNIIDKKVMRPIDETRTNEVLQAMDQFPKLISAQKNGKNVCSYWYVSVSFSK